MDVESDCSSFSDNLDSGYSTISNELPPCQSNDEETCLLKSPENLPKSEQSIQEISEFIPLMPTDLRNDLIDVLIICQPSDKDDAEVFKEDIQSLKYKAEVLDCSVVNSKQLNDLYKRSLLYFLYVTEAFCCCTETLFKSHISLAESLNDENKKDNIVPVYVCQENKIHLDISLKYLNPIRYYKKDRDIKTVKKILEGKKREIFKRVNDLDVRRKKYFHKNKEELTLLHHKEKTRSLSLESKMNVKDNISEETNLKIPVSSTINEDNEFFFQCEMPSKNPNQPISESFTQSHNKKSPIEDEKKSQATVINTTKNYNITIQNVKYLTIEDNQESKDKNEMLMEGSKNERCQRNSSEGSSFTEDGQKP